MSLFVVIAICIFLVYGLLVYYIGRSLWRWMNPGSNRVFKILYIIVLAVVSTSFISSRFLGNWTVLSVIGSYWMAVFYLAIILLPLTHLSLFLLRWTSFNRDTVRKRAGITVLVLIAGLIGFGSFNAYSPVVVEYDVRIDKAAGDLKSLNVVMVSDTHFGVLSGRRHAERMVREINALKPDIVLLPGDIIDDDVDAYLRQGIDEVLKGMESRYGVYASLGNHDRFEGEITELIAVLENSGMTVLYDETKMVEGLTVAGRRDKSDRKRAALQDILRDTDKTAPLLLLDHQPNALDEAQQEGVDLILSGHTHRGQIFPGNLITSAIFENDWGYLRKGQLQSIVSSGYGFWGPPIRLGSRSEIVRITIEFEKLP